MKPSAYYEQLERDRDAQREALGQARLAGAIALALIALIIWAAYAVVRTWLM